MYNLIIALSIAAASFALGMTIAGTLVAGFVPASIAMLIAYFLLARRTGNQFRVIAERAAAEFQAGRMGPGLKLMESCLKLYEAYQEQYRLTKERLLAQPKGKQFDFNENAIFG